MPGKNGASYILMKNIATFKHKNPWNGKRGAGHLVTRWTEDWLKARVCGGCRPLPTEPIGSPLRSLMSRTGRLNPDMMMIMYNSMSVTVYMYDEEEF